MNASSTNGKRNSDDSSETNKSSEKFHSDRDSGSSAMPFTDYGQLHNSEHALSPKRYCKLPSENLGDTPLTVACAYGNLSTVRRLVEYDKVDINQRGNIWMCSRTYDQLPRNRLKRLVIGAALHIAVASSQVDVVRYLAHNYQTNINSNEYIEYRTYGLNDGFAISEGSTALHLATAHLYGKEQNEIIRCLLEHGADWTINDNYGRQCWELTENKDLTKLLLEYGVGLDSKHNSRSLNIAHKWARTLDEGAYDVIANAIYKGVRIEEPNADGLTPVMIAAIGDNCRRHNVTTFKRLLKQAIQPIDRSNRIDALELFGASLILSRESDLGLKYWKKAMKLRFEVSDESVIRKSTLILPKDVQIAFKNVREVETKEELENLSMMPPSFLEIQAYLALVRILGLKNKETIPRLIEYVVKNNSCCHQLFNYLNLFWLICDPIEPYLHFFKWMLHGLLSQASSEHSPAFREVMQFLERMLALLQKTTENDNFDFIHTILWFIVQFTFVMIDKSFTTQEGFEFEHFLCRAIRMRRRDIKGNDLLLLACSLVSQSNRREKSRYPSEKVVSTLIELGADPNSKNYDNETAIHILSHYKDGLSPALKFFYDPCSNCTGKRIADHILRKYKIPLNVSGIPPLKCLSARVVNRSCIIPFVHLQVLPPVLVKFINRHFSMSSIFAHS